MYVVRLFRRPSNHVLAVVGIIGLIACAIDTQAIGVADSDLAIYPNGIVEVTDQRYLGIQNGVFYDFEFSYGWLVQKYRPGQFMKRREWKWGFVYPSMELYPTTLGFSDIHRMSFSGIAGPTQRSIPLWPFLSCVCFHRSENYGYRSSKIGGSDVWMTPQANGLRSGAVISQPFFPLLVEMCRDFFVGIGLPAGVDVGRDLIQLRDHFRREDVIKVLAVSAFFRMIVCQQISEVVVDTGEPCVGGAALGQLVNFVG
jgi:hypothetical protein